MDYSDEIVRVYRECVDRLLINCASHFSGGGKPSERFAYDVVKMGEMNVLKKESVKIIASCMKEKDAMVEEAIEKAMLDALKEAEPELRSAYEAGLLHGADVPVREAVHQSLAGYSRQAVEQMNLVNTVMLESTLDAYKGAVMDIASRIDAAQKILNAETGNVILGVDSYTDAVKRAVKRMNENGLTGFVDHGGHKWSPEAYARMDILTTCKNAGRQIVFDRNQSYGNDLVYVRTNATARPKCYPWQGKVISQTDNGRSVRDLHGSVIEAVGISQTSFGQPDGLWGINCHHVPPSVFIEGASLVRGAEYMPGEKENARLYGLTQEQRKAERKVRYAKRESVMLDAAGDKAGAEEARKKADALEADLEALVDTYHDILVSDKNRTWVYGYRETNKPSKGAKK